MEEKRIRRRIFCWILFFMGALLLSGITAFPLHAELFWLYTHKEFFPVIMQDWISKVYEAVKGTDELFPFLAYGTDWLAFAHIVIALVFIGPLRDPVRNKWIIDWAIISCILVLPLALIAGPIREIPFFHRVIDCAFGIIGLIPLFIVRKDIRRLELLVSPQTK
jgi:hypothetical protein